MQPFFNPKCDIFVIKKLFYLKYVPHCKGAIYLETDYGFDVLGENNGEFANKT